MCESLCKEKTTPHTHRARQSKTGPTHFPGQFSYVKPIQFRLRSVTVEMHAGKLVWSLALLQFLTHEKNAPGYCWGLDLSAGVPNIRPHLNSVYSLINLSVLTQTDRSLFSIRSHPSIVCFIPLNLNSFQPNHPPSTFPPRWHLPGPARLSKANCPVRIIHLWPMEPDYQKQVFGWTERVDSLDVLNSKLWPSGQPWHINILRSANADFHCIRRHSYILKNEQWQCAVTGF